MRRFVDVLAARHLVPWPGVGSSTSPSHYSFMVELAAQQQSTAAGISREFRIPLFLNFSALLLLIMGVLILRARVAALHAEEELPPMADWDGIAVEVTS